jgi:hypothetical protein
MHGVRNALALADSEVIYVLGLRVGVLTDNTSQRAGRRASSEERAVARLVAEARAAGRELLTFGLTKRDILQYLHPDAIRETAPTFPGWDDAVRAWRRRSTADQSFKAFLTAEFGLRLSRDAIRRLATRTVELRGVPGEIKRLAATIAAQTTVAASTAV